MSFMEMLVYELKPRCRFSNIRTPPKRRYLNDRGSGGLKVFNIVVKKPSRGFLKRNNSLGVF